MNIAYFDCFSGAGGDMIVAALIDAGADAAVLRDALGGLGLKGYSISVEPTCQHGFAATRFDVQLDSKIKPPSRKLADIVGVIERSPVSGSVKRSAVRIFETLANAEAKVHGSSRDDVHFHEVGAVDAVIDIVGAVLALEMLHVDQVFCSPLPMGSGTIECDHGTLPVPAPATAELLRGKPIAGGAQSGELTTPTAAAVLVTLASGFGSLPAMTLKSVGYGAGTRNSDALPNLLRVMVGHSAGDPETDCAVLLETSIDDATPEVVGHCLERLLAEGALDAYAVPIHMKKWRSGVLLTVLCEPHLADALEGVLFSETTTFGIRRNSVQRVKMSRRHETVETPFGEIRMKVGERSGVATASPEYEDCKAAAGTHSVSLREVMARAYAAWTVKNQE